MKRVLITDDCHPELVAGLEQMGYSCAFKPNITAAEARVEIAEYEGLIINSKILVDQDFLAAAPLLRFVGRLGSGMEVVDKQAAAERGVAVFSSPEGNCNAVAEHAMGMLLTLLNNLHTADAEVRHRIWRREANRGVELEGKTIGIIGFGHTGSAFARKLQGWDMRVLAHDKYKTGFAANMSWVQECTPEYIQQESDIISLHLPLHSETRHYVSADFLSACRRGLILINTARGKCVDTSALVTALESGHLGGACLDVFENEKPEAYSFQESELFERLFGMPNVVLSPHIAGWTHESKLKMAKVLLVKIVNWRTSFLIAEKESL
jgi:D-3-phosphoglycerate dehydrogenase